MLIGGGEGKGGRAVRRNWGKRGEEEFIWGRAARINFLPALPHGAIRGRVLRVEKSRAEAFRDDRSLGRHRPFWPGVLAVDRSLPIGVSKRPLLGIEPLLSQQFPSVQASRLLQAVLAFSVTLQVTGRERVTCRCGREVLSS